MPYLAVILKGFLIFCFFLSATIFFLLKVNYAKHLQFGLETIEIKRSQFGIPYVRAPSFGSAMYGWGYATSQDRLFQMAFKRLIGKGRLSKYLGKKAVNVDKLFRQLNFEYWSNRTAQRMRTQHPIEYQYFENYVKGINDHVEFLNFLPIEFQLIGLEWEPWTVNDLFLQTKLLVWSQSQNMGEEFIRSQLLQNYTYEEVINLIPCGKLWDSFNLISIVTDDQITEKLPEWTFNGQTPKINPKKINDMIEIGLMPYLDADRGSNSWVIHGNHTESGLPLIANDPHLQSAIPHEWHQIRIQYVHNGRPVYWQGAAMTGIPAIVGKTPYWTLALTTIHADSQDLYKQKVERDYYIVDGQKIKLKSRVQIIEIKNQQTVEHLVQQTHRGPILSHVTYWGKMYEIDTKDKVSLSWTGFNDEYQTWLVNSHSAQIDNLEDLKKFMHYNTSSGPNMNALYATKDNHIGYIAIGSLPLRKNHQSGLFIKDGSTSENDWVGLINRQQQLSLHDPKKGYIVTANNKPVSSKYFNGAYESSIMTARANRIDEIIRQKINKQQKLSINDMKKIQLDTVDILCRQNVPNILQAVPQSIKYLQNFNCDFAKQSFGPTIYQVFFYQLFKTIKPNSSQPLNLLSSLGFHSYLFRYIRNFKNDEVKRNMEIAFDNTIKNLTDFFGTEKKQKWVWQKYHTDIIIHRPFSASDVLRPFYQKRFGGRGNLNTVNVAKMNKLSEGDFSVNHRANIRMIWSYAKNQKSFWIGDTGVSQKFYSRHYDDQFRLFTKDEYIEVCFAEQLQTLNEQF